MWESVSKSISKALGEPVRIISSSPVGGGCINEAFRVQTEANEFFIKRHQEALAPMFQSEFEALQELGATGTVRVPEPICWGSGEGYSWLVTTYLELSSCRGDSQFELGKQLASLHSIRKPYFGWIKDNTIGSTKQPNPPCQDWITFWRVHRLEWQLNLAGKKGGSFKGVDALLDHFESLFEDYNPQPALLHGDLWSGNISVLPDGTPVIFDPASYYGDPEAEFGIIDMFGGFTAEFYRGYDSVSPRHSGFTRRLPLYRLYHELNHFNLFGSSYQSACQSSIRQILDRL